MTVNTKPTILKISKRLFAVNGYEGFSVRTLAKESGFGISSIYHFFKDKDEILKEIFDATNKDLGIARTKLSKTSSAEAMLLDRIKFQFQHIEDVVFVLKYYLHFRPSFLKLDSGYLPAKGYLHIEEVLEVGVKNGEFNISSSEIAKEAKVIAHAINGYLIEYYPNPPTDDELKDVTNSIHKFLIRSLAKKEVNMN
ncbi:TetR/AcrR family transcriptional regulator [Candidatus Saccharibacteria bacterium]|nr:MAG: TetR/AcrR family transcriptional regulator [Candidatus Saccharibacteria bacterium]